MQCYIQFVCRCRLTSGRGRRDTCSRYRVGQGWHLTRGHVCHVLIWALSKLMILIIHK